MVHILQFPALKITASCKAGRQSENHVQGTVVWKDGESEAPRKFCTQRPVHSNYDDRPQPVRRDASAERLRCGSGAPDTLLKAEDPMRGPYRAPARHLRQTKESRPPSGAVFLKKATQRR